MVYTGLDPLDIGGASLRRKLTITAIPTVACNLGNDTLHSSSRLFHCKNGCLDRRWRLRKLS
jgi:hypothetical protein